MEWSKRDIKKRLKWLCKDRKIKYKVYFYYYGVQILFTYRDEHLLYVMRLRRSKNRKYKGDLKLADLEYNIWGMMKRAK